MKSAVTISLVEEARGGPFVFWDLEHGCEEAARLGYDAVEIFPPSADGAELEGGPLSDRITAQLEKHNLQLAAVGTGAGWVRRKLTLTDANAGQRAQARDYVRSIIDLAGPFGASAIIGSMQGRWGGEVSKNQALQWLADAVAELGAYAAEKHSVPLLFEPINRYETNLVNRVGEGVELLESRPGTENVKLLADLFHMNIEEVDIAQALLDAGKHVGHIHFVDTNRRPAGSGHMNYAPIIEALKQINFQGYLSAESLPHPNPDEAARLQIETIRSVTR